MADKYLDCKSLNCPLPVVNIGLALKDLSIGQTLEVEATDPAFKSDVTAFVTQMKHKITLMEEMEEGKVIKVIIQKER